MSNRTKAAGTRERHAPQHRKDPFWTVGDLAGVPGGLGAKIVVAGVAGATLALQPCRHSPRPLRSTPALAHA